MARRGIARALGQQCEPFAESPEESLWTQHSHPRGTKLDRKRKSVEPGTDLRDRRSVLARQLELGLHRLRAREEELHRLVRRKNRRRLGLAKVGHGERRHGIFVLAREVKRRAARDECLQIRCRGEKRANSRAGIEELLEVVEDEEEVLVAQVVLQRLGERLAGPFPHRKRLGDRRDEEMRIADRGEVDEEDSVLEIRDQFRRHLERETGLAGATRSRERDKPNALSAQEGNGLLHLLLAPDQHRRLNRQIRGPPFKSLQGRKVVLEPRNHELVEPLRLCEVLETVLPEVPQAYRVGELLGKKVPR